MKSIILLIIVSLIAPSQTLSCSPDIDKMFATQANKLITSGEVQVGDPVFFDAQLESMGLNVTETDYLAYDFFNKTAGINFFDSPSYPSFIHRVASNAILIKLSWDPNFLLSQRLVLGEGFVGVNFFTNLYPSCIQSQAWVYEAIITNPASVGGSWNESVYGLYSTSDVTFAYYVLKLTFPSPFGSQSKMFYGCSAYGPSIRDSTIAIGQMNTVERTVVVDMDNSSKGWGIGSVLTSSRINPFSASGNETQLIDILQLYSFPPQTPTYVTDFTCL